MDIMDNVVPYISGEEEKMESEAQKILGTINEDITGFVDQRLPISSACNRVMVLDGHMSCVSLRFKNRPPPNVEQVKDAMRNYVSDVQKLGCPSAPEKAIVVMEEPDRPQPRLDRETDRGYAVSVGRIREDESKVFDLKFVGLSHNSTFLENPFDIPVLTRCSNHWRFWCFNIERRSSSAKRMGLNLPSAFFRIPSANTLSRRLILDEKNYFLCTGRHQRRCD